jgi:glycosyltransferase involved in cell wall biosynthesis
LTDPKPETTILIPVWGRYGGEVLLEAVESLRAQDVPVRIVVIDNASDDPLPELPGVDVIRAPARLTVGAARNLGLEHARTPYVLFWDADDLMLPGTLAFLEERLRSHPDVVASAASIMEDEPRVPHRWPPRWAARLARLRRTFATADCVWSMLPTTGATLMRADAVREAGGFAAANSGEDWVLGVSLVFRGRVELHSRPGRVYRRHVGSLWEQRRSPRDLLRHAAAVDRRLLNDPGIPPWGKLLTPAVAVLQALVLLAVGPAFKSAQRILRSE